MIRTRSLLSSFLLVSLTACVVHREQFFVGGADYVLADNTAVDGATETYSLRLGAAGNATLRVTTEYDKERPFLGFKLLELDKQAAEKRGLRPYSGLLVKGVYPDSSAQRAGVVAGDILFALGDRETIYRVQVGDIEAGLKEGQQITARLGRGGEQIELQLSPELLKERITSTESIALERSSLGRRPYAGFHLRGIPAVWCEKIYGEKRNGIVVTNVEVGSPAWLAGLRGGDVIDEIDGQPTPPLKEVTRMIAERGEAGQPMQVAVSRVGSPDYETSIDLHDYSGETNIGVPFIFHLENGVYRDRWGIGPWGIIANNRNTYVTDASTRRVNTRNVFKALLGLIKIDSRPDETRIRLLWFIHFDS